MTAYFWACARRDEIALAEVLAQGVPEWALHKQFKRCGQKAVSLEFFLRTHRTLPLWSELDQLYHGEIPTLLLPCDRIKLRSPERIISQAAFKQAGLLFEMLCRHGDTSERRLRHIFAYTGCDALVRVRGVYKAAKYGHLKTMLIILGWLRHFVPPIYCGRRVHALLNSASMRNHPLKRLDIRRDIYVTPFDSFTLIKIARTGAASRGHGDVMDAITNPKKEFNPMLIDQFLRRGQVKYLARCQLPVEDYIRYVRLYGCQIYLGKKAIMFLARQPELAHELSLETAHRFLKFVIPAGKRHPRLIPELHSLLHGPLVATPLCCDFFIVCCQAQRQPYPYNINVFSVIVNVLQQRPQIWYNPIAHAYVDDDLAIAVTLRGVVIEAEWDNEIQGRYQILEREGLLTPLAKLVLLYI